MRKELRDRKLLRKVFIDVEADGASISAKKGEVLLEVVLLLNEAINNIFTYDVDEKQALIEEMKTHKVPKGQDYKDSSILAISLGDQQYGAAQILEKSEVWGSPVCV
ncbi:hypothetical protein JCM19046_2942 [Bacillus sp. JCM 19046]|nr:hypothetical protein JCM19045_517 [Bacillus sp. JCM 19045]GAF18369.1 hypothetical protein JCM19046_2942 [Bacillus sp. JCM 19046]